MISRVCSEAFTRIHRGLAGFGSCQGSTCLVWLRPAGCLLSLTVCTHRSQILSTASWWYQKNTIWNLCQCLAIVMMPSLFLFCAGMANKPVSHDSGPVLIEEASSGWSFEYLSGWFVAGDIYCDRNLKKMMSLQRRNRWLPMMRIVIYCVWLVHVHDYLFLHWIPCKDYWPQDDPNHWLYWADSQVGQVNFMVVEMFVLSIIEFMADLGCSVQLTPELYQSLYKKNSQAGTTSFKV